MKKMIINCERCNCEYEIVVSIFNKKAVSECPDCEHRNKVKLFKSRISREIEKNNLHGMRFSGFWIRAVAYFYDVIIILILCTVIFCGIAIAINGTNGYGLSWYGINWALDSFDVRIADTLIYAVLFTGTFLYFWIFVGAIGRTPGKMLLGLKIVNGSDYKKITWLKAFARLWAISLSSLVLFIGNIMAAFSDKLALHDYICNTRVVNIREPKKSKLIFYICLGFILLILVSILVIFVIINI